MSSPYSRSERGRGSPSQPQSRPLTRSGKLSREYSQSNAQMPQVLTEFAQLLVNNDDRFNQQLDAASQQQKALHVQSLANALRKHDAVRESAERVQQQIRLELQAEQVRQEREQARKLAEAKEKLAAEQREALKRLEEERRRDEERKQQEAQLKRERDEAAQRQREEAEQKARDKAAQEKEAADKRERESQAAQQQQQAQAQAQAQQAKQQQEQEARARQQQNPAPSQTQTQTQTQASPSTQASGVNSRLEALQSTDDQREREHAAYLAMKKELKNSRARLDAAKQHDPWLKQNLGDKYRRRIRALMGQVNKTDKAANSKIVKEITALLDDAKPKYPTETLDISSFFLNGNPEPNQSPQFPLLLFDLLNHTAKAIINQFATEAAIDRACAEPIGIVAATIFANPNYCFHGHSLITILWARYHQRCPVLFGIWGDERNAPGRAKMGWKENDERRHQDLTKGLASGFAAITLRDFSKNSKKNPAPNRLFWECLARIVNVEPKNRLPTHFIALESLLDPIFVPRFITFYGKAAIAVLKLVTGDYTKIPPDRVPVVIAAKRMEALKSKLAIDLNIWL